MPDAGYQKAEKGYKRLEVYKLAHGLAVRIHKMSLGLPGFEKYEEASQIRRSSKRVSASIVEGHSVRIHKALYLNYLDRALGSADETQEHLELLRETGSLSDETEFRKLLEGYQELSRKLSRFIDGVRKQHRTDRRAEEEYAPEPPLEDDPDGIAALELARRHPASGIRNHGVEVRNTGIKES